MKREKTEEGIFRFSKNSCALRIKAACDGKLIVFFQL